MFLVLQAKAQLNASVTGDAIDQGNNCYIITPDQLNQAGGVWYNNPIDFDNDFSIYYQNYFGLNDANGADGMALVIKSNPNPEIGGVGGGLGYSGISPSLVIEFDTFQNTSGGDPGEDHIAIMQNGVSNQNDAVFNLAGPVQASPTSINIEDDLFHEVKVEWNAATNTLSVFFDCQLRLTLTREIKNSIFSGDDSVFFGFVGSTGGLSNLNSVCLNRVSFVDDLQIADEEVCENSAVQVFASIPSGISYTWLPTTGVSEPNSANPFLSPANTTTYTVTITDVCGETVSEELTVTVRPNIETEPIFDPVPPVCEEETLAALPTTSLDGINGEWSPSLNSTETTTYTFTPFADQCAPQTTLTIEVIPNEIPEFNSVDPVCPGEFLAELPQTSLNGITGTWSPQINNQTTTEYTFTPNPGQGCVATIRLEIEITDPIIPTFEPIDAVCEGDSIEDLPTTSLEGISGSWSPDVNTLETTTYTFFPDPGQCAAKANLEIEVTPLSQLSIDIVFVSEAFSESQAVEIIVNGGTGDYEYQLNNGQWVNNSTFRNLNSCETYQISVRETSSCSLPASKAFNVFNFPDFFTPNSDGINDTWTVDCLSEQSEAIIIITNRYGKVINSFRPSQTTWDGTYNGQALPANDYWFSIEYLDNEGKPSIFKSHFTLKR